MAKEREILRLHFEGMSQREICAALKVGHTRVSELVRAVRQAQIGWKAVGVMDDGDICALLLPSLTRESTYAKPDFENLAKELIRPGVTRKLLWNTYCSNITDKNTPPYQYAQFCRLFDEHLKTSKAVMRLHHEPGKRCFIDWAGMCATVWDEVLGSSMKGYLFVACLPYSAYMFVYAFPSMEQRYWLEGHMLAFEFFGGVPAIITPDNCSTATDRSPIYTTLINETYRDFATYYQSAVVPARVRKSNDKALVEASVLIAERQILAPLRDERFFTFNDLNTAIAMRLDVINETPFQRREGSRLSVFLEEEKSSLKPLAPRRYEMVEHRRAKVSLDYHIQVDSQRYSVDYRLIGKTLEVRLTESTVRIFDGTKEVALHTRLHGRKGQYATSKEHMPPAHQHYNDSWSPERFTSWAANIGPGTVWAIESVLASRAVVEQAFVPCINILNLARKGKRELLEAACQEIRTRQGSPTYSSVKNTMAAITTSRKLSTGITEAENAVLKDSLKDAGLTRGASYYTIGGDLS